MAALLAAAAMAASGCSTEAETEPLVIGGEPSSTPTASASTSTAPSPSAGSPATFDDTGHEVVEGLVETRNEREKAVVDAWIAYWRVRLDAFNAAEVDATRLGEVATGNAAAEVVGYVDFLARQELSTVGDMRMGVDEIRVQGDRATLRSCVENKTVDRNSAGKAVEAVSPFFVFRGELRRAAGDWRVSELSIDSRTPC